jgi:hypothetical protein
VLRDTREEEATTMKIKEAFKKVEVYNEIADLENEKRKVIWFADVIAECIRDGTTFTSFDSFRKYVRKNYIKDVADQILNEDWELNSEKEIVNNVGRTMKLVLYVTAA